MQKFAGSPDKTNDSSYFSWVALDLGVCLPLGPLKVEPYMGYEDGSYGFTSGTSASFSGPAGNVGLAFRYSELSLLRVNFEYRRHFFNSDNAGALPPGTSTTLTSYYLGIGVGFF